MPRVIIGGMGDYMERAVVIADLVPSKAPAAMLLYASHVANRSSAPVVFASTRPNATHTFKPFHTIELDARSLSALIQEHMTSACPARFQARTSAAKLLFPLILPISKAILLDIDMLLFRRLDTLWRALGSGFISAVHERSNYYPRMFGVPGWNGGVQLIDFEHARLHRNLYLSGIQNASSLWCALRKRRYFKNAKQHHEQISFGDQTMFALQPKMMDTLSCDWNLQLGSWLGMAPYIQPKKDCDACGIVHFNIWNSKDCVNNETLSDPCRVMSMPHCNKLLLPFKQMCCRSRPDKLENEFENEFRNIS